MMERLDLAVGDILNKLNELNIDNNTIFIFTSDNGPHKEGGADPDFFNSNGPLKGYKRDLYEGGIRVPFIVRWPGKVNAGHSDHITAFWDLLPTFCDISGIENNDTLDGISILPLLQGHDNQAEHEYLYWEFYEQGGKQAIRQGPWKGIRLNVKENRDAPIEIYNLDEDISENNNIADQHPDIVDRIDQLMEEAHEPSEVFMW
jgi:arylsulfatase A-like enzyme